MGMTKVKVGPKLVWTEREKNWTKIEWYRLTDEKGKEAWIEEYCVDEVWSLTGSFVWNRAYYFENPKEALFFKVAWT